MFKLEFDPANKALALAMGNALVNYANGVTGSASAMGALVVSEQEIAEAYRNAPVDERSLAEIQESDNVVKLNDSANGHSESTSSSDQATTGPQETAEQGAGGVPDVDKNGVPPNWSYCAKAAKPFYASGKYAGQWKKGTKVSQEDYDGWYLAAKADAVAQHPANKVAEEAYDTSQAFAGEKPEVVNTGAPVGIGPFIMWTAEMQTAGHLTQDDISGAYKLLGIEQADISPANQNAQANIAALHAVLSDKVKA